MAPASHGLLGRIQQANDADSNRFGPHTAEVEAFIAAAVLLTPWQWRQVLTVRRLVASVSKDGAVAADSARTIQAAIRASDTRLSETMARAGEVLFESLAKKSDDKQVAAWQAMTALISRSHTPALKFAVHYAPFAGVIPTAGSDLLDPRTRRYIALLEVLTRDKVVALSTRWRAEPTASAALVAAMAKSRHSPAEEAVALAALSYIPHQLAGDEGWAAIRTAVHGGRVLGALGELTPEQTASLWAPIEGVIALASLDSGDAIKQRRSRQPSAASRAAAVYGPNHAEVASFIKALVELTPIQWLRILDRRKLVSSVTREGATEPAGVVRSILIALDGTRDLDMYTRCKVFAAVERAGYVIETNGGADLDTIRDAMTPFQPSIEYEALNGGGFAHKVATLDSADWQRVAGAAPEANVEAVAPLINAGTALIDFFGGRSDDEAVATWHAVSALVHRRQLTPIKFAASYAPFASAIPATNPRSLGAMVARYVTAVGRLGASQCAALAKPWQLDDELSSVLSRAVADGSSRAGEEAAALAAVVTVPMRLAAAGGWSAVKTAAFGGRVIAVRTKLTAQQLEALWEPIQPAIPLSALSAPARAKR